MNEDCPSLKFGGKLADIAALRHGDRTALCPTLDNTTRNRLSKMLPPGREVALVLGGNGFVGIHLVARLSREPGLRKVLATVRATPGCTPEQRLKQALARYKITDLNLNRVTLVDVDPTKAMFGLSTERYIALTEEVDMVFNCASSSDYTTSYLELRDDWVKSLFRILQFSIEAKRKHVTYMGSISAYFYQNPSDFHRPNSWWYSGYAQMKWVNGELLRWLARDGSLSVTLCEAPYVFGSTKVGLDPGQHYSWWRIIEIARSIGLIWDGAGMNYTPVDILVEVLTINALLDKPLSRLLPRNPEPTTIRCSLSCWGLSWSAGNSSSKRPRGRSLRGV
jgi:nucleoside-diphosphate-sugar epimerase